MQIGLDPNLVQTLSTVVLAVFTVVLAVVTWLYYRQSRFQTDEMKKTRELNHEPHMKAGLKPNGPNFEIGFVNIGGGIAQNVTAEYHVKGVDEYGREWGTAIHFPGDIQRIGLPLDDSKIGVVGMSEEIESKLGDRDDTFVVNWRYEDSRGEEFEHTETFSLFEELEKHSKSTEFYSGEGRDVNF